jgi:hypothetical protein
VFRRGGLLVNSNVVNAAITFGAALGGGIVAGILSGSYQHIRDVLSRPKLKLDFNSESPLYVVKSKGKDKDGEFDDRYVRVRVRNLGRTTASGCRVYLSEIREVHGDKTNPTSFTEAMELSWPLNEYGRRDIPNGPDFYVDLVKFYSRDKRWNIAVKQLYSSQESLGSHVGTYRFYICATADNTKADKLEVEVMYNGTIKDLRAFQVSRPGKSWA